MHPARKRVASTLVPAALVLSLLPAPAGAALTILSSNRTVSASAQCSSQPAGLSASDSNSTPNLLGPSTYSTGPIAVTGTVVEGPDTGHPSASANASLTTNLAATTGFSFASSLADQANGVFLSNSGTGTTETTLTVSFAVDVPTSFSLTSHLFVSYNTFSSTMASSPWRAKVTLTDFLDSTRTGNGNGSASDYTPTPFSVSGTFLPGKTYTLFVDHYLQVYNPKFNSYNESSTLSVNLGNLTALPEPTLFATLPLLAAPLLRRRRSHFHA